MVGATGIDQAMETAIEEAIVRAVQSEAVERSMTRIINGPLIENAVRDAMKAERMRRAGTERPRRFGTGRPALGKDPRKRRNAETHPAHRGSSRSEGRDRFPEPGAGRRPRPRRSPVSPG